MHFLGLVKRLIADRESNLKCRQKKEIMGRKGAVTAAEVRNECSDMFRETEKSPMEAEIS